MMATMNAPSPHNKIRANSDGYDAAEFGSDNFGLLHPDHSHHQRASSSEAQLPSYHDHNTRAHGHAYGHEDRDDDSTNTAETPRASHYNNQPQQPQQQTNAATTTPKLQRLQPVPVLCALSDSPSTKRLQTIESGISLSDSAQAPQSSPKPPLHPSNSYSYGSLPPIPSIDNKEVVNSDSNPGSARRPEILRTRLQSDQTTNSYYSVDAGKHGFLTAHGDYYDNDSTSDGGSVDNKSAVSNDTNNGSLVFKYQPGQETPPAEYALPASILKVYGVDAYADHVHNEGKEEKSSGSGSGTSPSMENGNGTGLQWHYAANNRADSKSSIVYSFSSDEEDLKQPNNYVKVAKVTNTGTPSTSATSASSSGLSVPHLRLSSSDEASSDDHLSSLRNSGGMLPYHERKRLMELEEEEKKRKEEASAKQKKLKKKHSKNVQQQPNKYSKKSSGRTKEERSKNDETTPLNGQSGGYGTPTKIDTIDEQIPHEKPNTTWFGQLVQIVTGKSDASIEHDGEDKKQQRRQDSIVEYHDRGQAFLKKTEKERLKKKEQSRMDELNNVTIPVARQSFSHSRAKMSSLSNALDSIVSCSDDEEEESCSSEDDEESGQHHHYWKQDQPPNKVWKYGEPPTALANKPNAPNNNKKKTSHTNKLSKHDRIMKRERLLQEEYEYRLHSLKAENEKLSKRFRVFVLVTVAVVFAGALAFAFAVCVKMLMSI